jgi:hypothetical protein
MGKILESESITGEAERRRECGSARLQLSSAAKAAAHGLGGGHAAVARLEAARDAVSASCTA